MVKRRPKFGKVTLKNDRRFDQDKLFISCFYEFFTKIVCVFHLVDLKQRICYNIGQGFFPRSMIILKSIFDIFVTFPKNEQ